jgi:hypothetical protein
LIDLLQERNVMALIARIIGLSFFTSGLGIGLGFAFFRQNSDCAGVCLLLTMFNVCCQFPNGVELIIRDSAQDLGFDNGILFEGEKGKFFVSRTKISGEPVEALKSNPIDPSVLVKLRKGRRLDSYMGNFFECVRDRAEPVSDVLEPSPGIDDLSPRQHCHSVGTRFDMGPRNAANSRRQRSQQLAKTRTAPWI